MGSAPVLAGLVQLAACASSGGRNGKSPWWSPKGRFANAWALGIGAGMPG